jgi:hypothetical protein
MRSQLMAVDSGAAAADPDVAVAAGPEVVVVVVVVVVAAAAAAAAAVPLPIARKLTRNTRGQCVEETSYMLGKQGHRAAKLD